MLDYNCLEKATTEDNKTLFTVKYERKKASGVQKDEAQYAIILGQQEVYAISTYLDTFKDESNGNGRLFQKFTFRNNVLVATRETIGKNTAAEIGKKIAARLKLQDAAKYTGHCWRATAITWAANAGLSKNEINALSGHKSDAVVDNYIRQSVPMKMVTSGAVSLVQDEELSVGNKRPYEEVAPPSSVSATSSSSSSSSSFSSSGHVYTFSGAVFNGPVTFSK